MKRKQRIRRVMNELGKCPGSTYQKEEYIIANSGKREVRSVSVGGKEVELFMSGATTYDKGLAMEIKDKYSTSEVFNDALAEIESL